MSYDNINQYDQQQQQQLTYLLDDNMNMTNILYDSQSSNSIFGDNITNTANPTTTMNGQKFSTKVAVKSSAHVSYIVGKQGNFVFATLKSVLKINIFCVFRFENTSNTTRNRYIHTNTGKW